MYIWALTTDTQRSGGQTLGKCVCILCVHVSLQLESTNSCRDRLPVPPESPRASLSIPYQRMEGLSLSGADTADAQVLRLQMCGDLPLPWCCGAILVLVEQERILRGRIPPESGSGGSWEGSPRLHPRGEGGVAAAHRTHGHGHAQPFHSSSACRRCYGYRLAWKGEGKGLGRTGFEDEDSSEGTFGCVGTWVAGHCPGVATCGHCGVRLAVNKNAEACVQGGCSGVAEPWKMAEGMVWEGAEPALER